MLWTFSIWMKGGEEGAGIAVEGVDMRDVSGCRWWLPRRDLLAPKERSV